MDATTLYVIVLLANRDIRTADVIPLGNVQRCQEATQQMRHGWINNYLRARGKSVMLFAPRALRRWSLPTRNVDGRCNALPPSRFRTAANI